MENKSIPCQRLVLEHQALVHSIAIRIRRSYQIDMDIDELISFGFMGLVEAANRFDPERGYRFSTFAYYRIRGAIIDGLAEIGPLPRPRARAFRPRRCATPIGTLPSDALSAHGALERAQSMAMVRSEVGKLSERTRYLIERRYWGAETLVDIGTELGISKSRASRIHSAAIRELRERMEVLKAA